MYPLLEALAQVPDFRKSQGKRHPSAAVLALACAATLCGCSSLTAIAQWGREQGKTLLTRLGFTRFPTPCVATCHRIFRRLEVEALEAALTRWLQTWLPPGGGLSLDGKTLRGSRDEDQDPVQLLAAFSQRLGTTLAQAAIPGRDEVETAITLLQSLDLHGWIVTGDVGLAHQPLAEAVLQQGGDYVLTIKGNQPTLQENIALLFSDPAVVANTITYATQVNLHGGRIERRTLAASIALVGYSRWPGLAQVFQLERQVTRKKTQTTVREVVFGVTGLPPEKADAERLLALSRGHWGIENRLHRVRDVIFGEDKSRVRSGHTPPGDGGPVQHRHRPLASRRVCRHCRRLPSSGHSPSKSNPLCLPFPPNPFQRE